MLHWTPECCTPSIGLNVYVTKWWFRLIWVWYDVATTSCTSRYFRLRLFPFKLFISKNTYDVVENKIAMYRLTVITREQRQDLLETLRSFGMKCDPEEYYLKNVYTERYTT